MRPGRPIDASISFDERVLFEKSSAPRCDQTKDRGVLSVLYQSALERPVEMVFYSLAVMVMSKLKLVIPVTSGETLSISLT